MLKKKIVLLLLLLIPTLVSAKEVNLYLFHGDGCPHCAKEREYLKEIEKEYDDVNIHLYEVWYDTDNQELMEKVKKELNSSTNYVPLTIIGDKYTVGFNDNTKLMIKNNIEKCLKEDCEDVVGNVLAGKTANETTIKKEVKEQKKDKEDSIKDLPILGKVDVKKVSLPIMSAVIGLVDGFNPCAMWVLVFLISMLLGTKDRKKMWILGLTFLFTSAFIYLLFMVAWLNVAIKMNTVIWLRITIAIIAIIAAFINLKSFYKSLKKDTGCEVVDSKKRKNIIEKIKKFTLEKSLILGLLGVMTLAVSVNFIELACSAGLPLLFTQILALNNLSKLSYMIYILIYIFFFLIDDIIVFVIAMFTLKITGISNKYSKYSHLIGGIIMLLIGLLMIIKPEWLMLNF
jgi:cytochrome c biogenesis protein CcdA/glutaredoxin